MTLQRTKELILQSGGAVMTCDRLRAAEGPALWETSVS